VTNTNEAPITAEEILSGIRRWVEIETPSRDGAAVNRLVDLVEADFAGAGARITRTPGREGCGDILRAASPWGGDGPGILVLAHLDTVHPKGTAASDLAFRVEGDKAFGCGILDMKSGGHMAYYAYRHLVRTGRTAPLPIVFLFIPDEEIGSGTARELIEAEARKHKYVLVCEPARDGGKIVTARKGVGMFTIKVKGRPAHAGVRHEDGRSALKELAHQILALEAMTDYGRGITVSVGLASGGTGVNVVPAQAQAEVDLRVPDQAVAEEMTARIKGLRPAFPDTVVAVEGGMNRPPMPRTKAIMALFDHAKGLAAEIGFELKDVPLTGGGSDGNFTAALGIPTLDGLGADGAGPHTLNEHILIPSLVPRTRLLLRLFETLR